MIGVMVVGGGGEVTGLTIGVLGLVPGLGLTMGTVASNWVVNGSTFSSFLLFWIASGRGFSATLEPEDTKSRISSYLFFCTYH